MLRKRESCGAISFQIVALLTAIEVGSSGKLPSVLILMAVHALGELHVIESGLALRQVTPGALDGGVLLEQRIGRGRVFLDAKCRRLESLYVMTGPAFSLIGPLHELPVVLILVAVETVLEG